MIIRLTYADHTIGLTNWLGGGLEKARKYYSHQSHAGKEVIKVDKL